MRYTNEQKAEVYRLVADAEKNISVKTGVQIALDVTVLTNMVTPMDSVILEKVLAELNISYDEVMSRSRKMIISDVRTIAAVILKKYCPHLRTLATAKMLGLMDHTTVLHMYKKHDRLMSIDDEKYKPLFLRAEAAIDNWLKGGKNE